MQSPHVPTGPRNPHGYTAEEVLRAIRGVDGARELSFRYELLDKDLNVKIPEMDNVLGGAVQMHYISEIKRTADFEIRGGDDIDWLFDHIKPYCRVKMPPRIMQDGIVLNSLWYNSFDNPSDGTVLTPGNSIDYGDPVSSTDGVVRYSTLWSASGSSSCLLGSDDGSDSGRISLNFRARTSWKISMYMRIPFGSYVNIFPEGLAPNPQNDMQFDDIFQHWRMGSIDITNIKNNLLGRTIRLEVLNDGLRCRYSLWWTDPLGNGPADFTATEDSSEWDPIQIMFVGGGGFGRNPSAVDEVRVSTPAGDEYIPRTVPVWQNTFNGDPDIFVDVDSLRYYGNIPDEIRGRLSFNDSWFVDPGSGASLQLGDDGTFGRGALQLSVPSRSSWNLKFWANIPEGGKLYVAPSSEDYVPSPDEAPPWAGPIQKIGVSGGAGDWNLATTCAVPSGVQEGDYLVAIVTSNGSGDLDEPAGWEPLAFREFGAFTRMWIFGKFVGADEPTHHQFTFNEEHWHSSAISAMRNVLGVRHAAINGGEDVTSISMPVVGSIAGDALIAVGFDWSEVNKQWDDAGAMTPETHHIRGLLISSLMGLSTDPTPSYTLTTETGSPSRMAAATVVFSSIPDPENPNPYPGPLQFIGFSEGDENGWTDELNVDVPGLAIDGDYMITVLTANFNDELTPAPGWDFLDSVNMGAGTSLFTYGRFVSPSEPASHQWLWNGEHWHRAACFVWRNSLGPRSVNLVGGEDVNSLMLPSVSANEGDSLFAFGFDWGDNDKVFEDDGEMTEILNQSGTGGSLYARMMDLEAGQTPSYEFTSDAPAPTRMTVGAIVLEAYQDPGSQPGPFRGPNWIVLDDDGGEYSIAGTDVTLFRDQLFGTPIRIEMEVENGEYYWRVYSTDPMGDAPDINWFGSSSEWGPFRSCLFQGGGVGLEPTLIDNLTIGRTIPVNRPTPDETNYVEFPLGVFLLSSPTRDSDRDDVITREVEAYDRTKLFIDDKLTEVLNIPKGTNYTDVISELLGDIPKIVEPSNKVAGRDRQFQVGTSIKEVVDTIAEGINYHTLRFDEEGRAIVQPYVNPTNRSPEYHYQDDEISIMFPDVSVKFDSFDIANVWIASISEADGDVIYAKIENHDPTNPFSIPRRGRRIVDYREEEETTDSTSLLRKVKRLQFEANRLYETVSFDTLINPLHSANDCYNITYGPLGIDEKYTEINWEIPLEAGSTMTHTARRVVKLDAALDEGFVEGELEVIGSLTAGNIKWGIATIDFSNPSVPVNAPVMVQVTGLDLKGSGPVQVFVTPVSSVPGVTLRQATTSAENPDGFQIWAVRRTNTLTNFHWLAMRSL